MQGAYAGVCGLVPVEPIPETVNTGEIKEPVVDFHRGKLTPSTLVTIQGTEIEIVDSYSYLGVRLDNKLDWTFYESVVASGIFY